MAGVKGKTGKNPNSLANLTNINDIVDHDGKVEAGKKGGVASGIARKQKKEMREIVQDLFRMGIRNGKITEEFKSLEDTKGKNMTVSQALVLAQIKKAMTGDTRALEFLRDTAGEKPIEEKRITADVSTQGKLDEILAELQNDSETEDKND